MRVVRVARSDSIAGSANELEEHWRPGAAASGTRVPRVPAIHSEQHGQTCGTKTVNVAEYFVSSYPSPFSSGAVLWATTR